MLRDDGTTSLRTSRSLILIKNLVLPKGLLNPQRQQSGPSMLLFLHMYLLTNFLLFLMLCYCYCNCIFMHVYALCNYIKKGAIQIKIIIIIVIRLELELP